MSLRFRIVKDVDGEGDRIVVGAEERHVVYEAIAVHDLGDHREARMTRRPFAVGVIVVVELMSIVRVGISLAFMACEECGRCRW